LFCRQKKAGIYFLIRLADIGSLSGSLNEHRDFKQRMSLAIAGVRQAVLLTILFVTGSAFAYGLLADFSDLLFGFWGTFVVVLLPLLTLCAGLLLRIAPAAGRGLAVQLILLGVVYPCAAGLDLARQPLYLNLCALGLLLFTAWLLRRRLADDQAQSGTADRSHV
jgi:hypothetical protein